jgi:hypothetical protein
VSSWQRKGIVLMTWINIFGCVLGICGLIGTAWCIHKMISLNGVVKHFQLEQIGVYFTPWFEMEKVVPVPPEHFEDHLRRFDMLKLNPQNETGPRWAYINGGPARLSPVMFDISTEPGSNSTQIKCQVFTHKYHLLFLPIWCLVCAGVMIAVSNSPWPFMPMLLFGVIGSVFASGFYWLVSRPAMKHYFNSKILNIPLPR